MKNAPPPLSMSPHEGNFCSDESEYSTGQWRCGLSGVLQEAGGLEGRARPGVEAEVVRRVRVETEALEALRAGDRRNRGLEVEAATSRRRVLGGAVAHLHHTAAELRELPVVEQPECQSEGSGGSLSFHFHPYGTCPGAWGERCSLLSLEEETKGNILNDIASYSIF